MYGLVTLHHVGSGRSAANRSICGSPFARSGFRAGSSWMLGRTGTCPWKPFLRRITRLFYSGMVALGCRARGVRIRHGGFPRRTGIRCSVFPFSSWPASAISSWHHFLGVEEGVDALLSPTHRHLAWASSSFRARRYFPRCARANTLTTLGDQLPLIFALATWIELVHFGTAYAFDPGAGRTECAAADRIRSRPTTLPRFRSVITNRHGRARRAFSKRPHGRVCALRRDPFSAASRCADAACICWAILPRPPHSRMIRRCSDGACDERRGRNSGRRIVARLAPDAGTRAAYRVLGAAVPVVIFCDVFHRDRRLRSACGGIGTCCWAR